MNPESLDLDSGLFEDAELEEELSRLRKDLEFLPSDPAKDGTEDEAVEDAPNSSSNVSDNRMLDKQLDMRPDRPHAEQDSQHLAMSQPDTLPEDEMDDSLSPPTSLGLSNSSLCDDDDIPVISPPIHRENNTPVASAAQEDKLKASGSGMASQNQTSSPDRVLTVISSPFESHTYATEKRILHSAWSKDSQDVAASLPAYQDQIATRESNAIEDDDSASLGAKFEQGGTTIQSEKKESARGATMTGATNGNTNPVLENIEKWKKDFLDAERATQILAEGHETGTGHKWGGQTKWMSS